MTHEVGLEENEGHRLAQIQLTSLGGRLRKRAGRPWEVVATAELGRRAATKVEVADELSGGGICEEGCCIALVVDENRSGLADSTQHKQRAVQ
ncbi:hypothetical protein [Oryza sativa Japonica Group]|uniref:Uncharacterized protein n=2 Tax=Oryza sativa subsp. japonica TaxID=39947 RepID=Q5NAH1_ORYSJ|nr:hypothetical protein [Oryza sativa Japonica Group]BAD82270.1 hypothetical protein [Oryza sativa Japonica Group]